MHLERDEFLTEAMGGCWHERAHRYPFHPSYNRCAKCCKQLEFNSKAYWDFSTWEGFGKLWEWLFTERSRWVPFHKRYMIGQDRDSHYLEFELSIINPDEFANRVYEFLKEKTL